MIRSRLVVSLGCVMWLCSGCVAQGVGDGSTDDKRLLEDTECAAGPDTLYTVRGNTEAEVTEEAETVRHVMTRELGCLGFDVGPVYARGAMRGSNAGVAFEIGIPGVGEWTGFIHRGGTLALEEGTSADVEAVGDEEYSWRALVLDFGSPIYTMAGQVAGPDVDRFVVEAAGRSAVLSHYVKADEAKQQSIAVDSNEVPLTSPPADAYVDCRAVTEIPVDGPVIWHREPDASEFFRRYNMR